jgi:hypothetical protein
MLSILSGTGEHGVGVGKKEFLVHELGVGTVQLMRTIKQAIDPDELFNPGKVSFRTGTARCVDPSLTAELHSCTPMWTVDSDCLYYFVSFFPPCWPACESGRCYHMR